MRHPHLPDVAVGSALWLKLHGERQASAAPAAPAPAPKRRKAVLDALKDADARKELGAST